MLSTGSSESSTWRDPTPIPDFLLPLSKPFGTHGYEQNAVLTVTETVTTPKKLFLMNICETKEEAFL
jgi:hypothetical protein